MAEAYCGWRGGRLPTEAQWEEAARGGLLAMDYPWGNDRPVCDKGAQNGANSYVCATKDTEAVGSYRPNGYGLFDMAGNVWEWVWDWYSSNYYSSQTSFVNPFGPVNGFLRVARGSSWNLVQAGMNDMSVANRGMQSPTYSSDDLGFRCVRAS